MDKQLGCIENFEPTFDINNEKKNNEIKKNNEKKNNEKKKTNEIKKINVDILLNYFVEEMPYFD